MRKLTLQSFALGSGGMPREHASGLCREEETPWVGDEGGWGTGAPSCWAVLLPTLSVSAASPGGGLCPPPTTGVSSNPGGRGLWQQVSVVWAPSSHLPWGPAWVFLQSPESPSPSHLAPARSSPRCPGWRSHRFGSSASHYAWWLACLHSAGLSADH